MNEKGTEHQFTMLGTPQQNGKAKQFNCTIIDKAMSMLYQASLFNGFWEHTVSTAVHIYNCTPIHLLEWKTPHKKWNPGKVPDVSYFHVFRCKAYMHVPADKHWKLDVKVLLVVLVGYEPNSKGYSLWDKNTCSVHLSRDVTFDESSFPAKTIETELTHIGAPAPSPVPLPFYPVIAVPHMPAMPPPPHAALPTSSSEDKDQVDNLLEPKEEWPVIPPIQATPLPTMPLAKCPPSSTPPPCPSALQTWKHKVLSPVDPVILGGSDAPVLTLRQSVQILVSN